MTHPISKEEQLQFALSASIEDYVTDQNERFELPSGRARDDAEDYRDMGERFARFCSESPCEFDEIVAAETLADTCGDGGGIVIAAFRLERHRIRAALNERRAA